MASGISFPNHYVTAKYGGRVGRIVGEESRGIAGIIINSQELAFGPLVDNTGGAFTASAMEVGDMALFSGAHVFIILGISHILGCIGPLGPILQPQGRGTAIIDDAVQVRGRCGKSNVYGARGEGEDITVKHDIGGTGSAAIAVHIDGPLVCT